MLLPNKKQMLCDVDDETGEVGNELCEEVFVESERIDLLTHTNVAYISMWKNGEKITFPIPRKHLTQKVLPLLMDKGFTMLDDPENIAAVLSYILDSDKTAPKIYEHRKLGFCEINGELVFLANEAIGKCKKQSHYFKPKTTAPRGTKDTWLAFANQNVIGRPNMELALAIGASAPVAHLLQKAKLITEVPIWGLIGESSTGKTSAIRLMASIYGSAEEGAGLIKDFNATDNAILAMLQDSGIVHLIDESTIAGKKNFSSLCYILSTGMDKRRCNPDGTLKNQQTFTGCVVITGEQSLLGQSTANLGLYARVVEPTLLWTDSADHARRLAQGVRENYGTAIVPYAEHLLKLQQHPNLLEAGFKQELAKFRDKVGAVSGVEERLLNSYVTVTLSAKLFKKALGLNLNVSGIRDLLVEIHRKATKKEDLAQELYNAVMDEVALHGQHFPTTSGKKRHSIAPDSLWGEQTTLQGKKVLWIVGSKFQEFARNHAFENPIPYLNDLNKRGLVKKYSDGFTTKHSLSGNQVRCYCFYKV